MNLLLDRPPRTVKIGGAEYEIHSDFRVSVLFELLMQDEEIPPEAKVERTLSLYFPKPPVREDIREVLQAVNWFYLCGRSDKEARLKSAVQEDDERGESEADNGQRVYSFDYDDEYIYAAFRQQYGINLSSVQYLHWWEFRAMFKALDEKCQFVKIMGYRAAKPGKGMSKEEKAFLRKMQRLYALPVPESERKQHDNLVSALLNGGDISALLRNEEGNRGQDG